MSRRTNPEREIDFTTAPEAINRAKVFFEALAYPAIEDRQRGERFQEALAHYYAWAVRKQYGLRKARNAGAALVAAEHWEGTLRQGGLRIRRRLQAKALWSKRLAWFEEYDGRPFDFSRRRSVRATLLADPERWSRAFRMNRRPATETTDLEDLIQRASAAVRESTPVLHLAWQLDKHSFALAAAAPSAWPEHMKRSWRYAFLRGPDWIDTAISDAEAWRLAQEPHRPNGLRADQLIRLVF